MEKKNSQTDYSEKLINLPGIGINYEKSKIKIEQNNTINTSKKIIFFNLQSLYKLLPQDDHIYLEIIEKEPNSFFWFIKADVESVTLQFKERLNRIFLTKNLFYEDYIFFNERINSSFIRISYASANFFTIFIKNYCAEMMNI